MASSNERCLKELLEDMGYFTTRCAGSLGGDLHISNNHNQSILIEEKTVSKDKNGNWIFYTSEKKEQYLMMKDMFLKDNRPTFYSIRWNRLPEHHGEPEWVKWENFLLGEKDKHTTRRNQKWPGFTPGNGYKAMEMFGVLLNSRDVMTTLNQYIKGDLP